jgi:hypothetical protein
MRIEEGENNKPWHHNGEMFLLLKFVKFIGVNYFLTNLGIFQVNLSGICDQ